MIKTLFVASLLLLVSSFSLLAEEVVDNPFTFKQPAPKISDAFLKQSAQMIKNGDKNVKLFIDKNQEAWDEEQKRQGRDEPSDVWMGCLLYQIDGPKSLDDIDLVHSALVLAGSEREDGKGNYTEKDAHALVDSWDSHQYEVAYKLWKAWNYYAASCYQYVHGGFIVKPAVYQTTYQYALDQ